MEVKLNLWLSVPLWVTFGKLGRILIPSFLICRASHVAQLVKHLPVMQETWVQLLGWEDPLEKKLATHSSILAWRISWTEEILSPSFLIYKAGINYTCLLVIVDIK